jgi:hypothetical protein
MQAAGQPVYASMATQLLRAEGSELYFRHPALFNLAEGQCA